MMDWTRPHGTAFLPRICRGKIDESPRGHAEIWPEMLAALRAENVLHYGIFRS
jgi:L-rhamnose mutarotase